MSNAPATDSRDLQMTDEALAAEKARGRLAGLLSVATVALFTAFIFATYLTIKDAQGKEGGGTDSLQLLTMINDHKLAYILSGFLYAVAMMLVSVLLVHILFAARERTTRVTKFPILIAIVGPLLVALAFPAYTLGNVAAANEFADAAQKTLEVATDLRGSTLLSISGAAWSIGRLLVATAWVMTGVYGMKVGLLTRLVGAVAVAIGIATIIVPPLAALLQIFWIGAVAIMLIGESPQTPPAWKLGRVVSWREVDALRKAEADKALAEEATGGSLPGEESDKPE